MRHELAMIVLASAWAFNAHATPVTHAHPATQATTIDWGDHDRIEAVSVHPTGDDDDFMPYKARGDARLFGTAASSHGDEEHGRKDGRRFRFEDDSRTPAGRHGFHGGVHGVAHELDLDAGNDDDRVVGTGPGASGGGYTPSSSPSDEPVLIAEAALAEATDLPEPQSHALVLAGLAAIGWVSLRRKA